MSLPHPGVLWTHRPRFSNTDTHKRPDSVLAGKIKQLLIAKKKKSESNQQPLPFRAPGNTLVSKEFLGRERRGSGNQQQKTKNLPTAKLPLQQQEAKSECLENTEL